MIEYKNNDFIPCKRFKSFQEENKGKGSEDRSEDDVLSSNRAEIEAGSYFLGPAIKCVRSPVTVRLGRKKGTDEYYLMKLLVLDDSNTSDRALYIRRTVFHNEYTILSLLRNHEGIIHLHDFFKDYIYKEINGEKRKLKRVGMAMECLFPHGPYNSDMLPLSHYLREERLTEIEALRILYNLLSVIDKMHKSNIVHREIKLFNIILNRKTLKVKLMDFYYAKVISSNSDPLECNKPILSSCLPKTNDVWAAGVIFYAMLCSGCPSGISKFGSLLSSVRSTQDLYLKLEENKCSLLKNSTISVGAKEILCCILCSLPQYRLKASEAVDMVSSLLAMHTSSQNQHLLVGNRNGDQIVPECSQFDHNNEQESSEYSPKYSLPAEKDTEDIKDEKSNKKDNKTVESDSIDVGFTPQCSSSGFSKSPKECKSSNRNNIKNAMIRLGATSLNNINALSFNYSKRNSCIS